MSSRDPILDLVLVSGALQQPSRTEVLLETILDELADHLPIRPRWVKLSGLGPLLAGTMARSATVPALESALCAIEQADALLVGSPVYRGSYTGLFKHLFDLIDQDSLHDVPVLLTATGGSERHALVIEHQLRPLFSFFQAYTLPVSVYGSEAAFSGNSVSSPALLDRIVLAVARAAPPFKAAATARSGYGTARHYCGVFDAGGSRR